MAKKVKKVIVHEAYYEGLVAKAELLDDMFETDENGEQTVIVSTSRLKDYAKIEKQFDKLPEDGTEVEEFVGAGTGSED